VRPALSLRAALFGFLTLTSLVSFVVVGLAGLAWHPTRQASEGARLLDSEARGLVERTETLLGAVQRPLQVVANTLRATPAAQRQSLLQQMMRGSHEFGAVYLASVDGAVQAVETAGAPRQDASQLIAADLSGNRLFRQARERQAPTWSDKYLSALTGHVVIGLAIPLDGMVLIGEIAPSTVLNAVNTAVGPLDIAVWLVDANGEVLADNRGAAGGNLATLPVVRAALDRQPLPARFEVGGVRYQAAAARSQILDWTFVVRLPTGLDSPRVRQAISFSLAAVGASLLVGIALAPLWAGWMARPITALVARARDLAAGVPVASWPRGRVAEFNGLSADLERMAESLREREQNFQAQFESSPVGMALCDPQADMTFVEINSSMVELFALARADALGHSDLALGLWPDAQERARWWRSIGTQAAAHEALLKRRDGSTFECRMLARTLRVGGQPRVVWVCEDVSEARALARDLYRLNAELERRVQQRTEDLAQANRTLLLTVDELRATQKELVRSEKLAALGALVARVAHELNTPIGNALLAVTTLQERAQRLARPGTAADDAPADDFVRQVLRGTDISHRNLAKAAELVTNFKQVAVDQASAQRRRFRLDEVVGDLMLTLSPTLERTPVRVHTALEPGLEMDSYPGALGLALSNLVRNALLHAFGPGQPGQVWISARATGDDGAVIEVRDDGIGIPPSLHAQVFDPFFTTKRGSGGSGLGLHIAHNAVENVLGGRLTLDSTEGSGSRFVLALPRVAPLRDPRATEQVDEQASGRAGTPKQAAAAG
jgi:PAS domain S-box-containing protein